VREQVLAIPTRSHRGLLINLAIGVGAQDLEDDLLDAMEGNEGSGDLLQALVADLRAMAAGTA
jgi:hypothetical protein